MSRLVTAPWWVRLRRWWRGPVSELQAVKEERDYHRDYGQIFLNEARAASLECRRLREQLAYETEQHMHIESQLQRKLDAITQLEQECETRRVWMRRAMVSLDQALREHTGAVSRSSVRAVGEMLRRGGL